MLPSYGTLRFQRQALGCTRQFSFSLSLLPSSSLSLPVYRTPSTVQSTVLSAAPSTVLSLSADCLTHCPPYRLSDYRLLYRPPSSTVYVGNQNSWDPYRLPYRLPYTVYRTFYRTVCRTISVARLSNALVHRTASDYRLLYRPPST